MIRIKTFVPTYFDKFRCIAGECPDTCCAGWEADLDSGIIEKYHTLGGELRERIDRNLTHDEDGCAIFSLCENGKCPFLNSGGLCDIQAAHGEEYLSVTCSMFPRFYDDFGKIREMGLGFGCPEAARIMLSDEEPFSLEFYDECVDEVEDVDEDFLSELITLRAEIFITLEDEDLSFRKKIERIFDLTEALQKDIDGEDYTDKFRQRDIDDCFAVFENMEYIKPERKAFVEKLRKEKLSKNALNLYRSDFEKLMKYYIFRYLLKAVYDYDVLTKVKYGVFACIVISRIYSHFEFPNFETRVRIMYSYSKEVEYSDVNTDILDTAMYEDFGIQDLINLL